MESANDLLHLPTVFEEQSSRYYIYNGNTSFRDKHRYEHSCDYENIARLKYQIKEKDDLLTRLARGANQGIRIRRVEAEKNRIVRKRQYIQAGWTRISFALRAESSKLFALPREIRDRIYEFLYTKNHIIHLDSPDPDNEGSMLPRDAWLYLNASVVNPIIASEAAHVLYQTNTFRFMTQYGSHIPRFLETDHFGSGVIPRNIIRRMHVCLDGHSFVSVPGDEVCTSAHGVFEDQLRSNIRMFSYGFTLRHLVDPFQRMPELSMLHFTIGSMYGRWVKDFREISPLIIRLKQKGVTVKVQLNHSMAWASEGEGSADDISNYFDHPAEEDKELVKNAGGAMLSDSLFYERIPPAGKCRVLFSEHYEVYKQKELEPRDGT